MSEEEIENYITELESIFELSELEEHNRNILKVGIYIKQLQQKNKQLKDKLIEINEVINGYMPNIHAMCKAFDEIEFILSKEVE